jgi:voltage-gated potassium channel
MKESARYILQILVFVALILLIGTVGYLLIEEGLKLSDAFYMAVTAITPTQFDEVHKLSVPGRYFTVVLVFCGFGAVVAFATQFARLIIQSELEGVGVFTRKQMRRRISRMKNHYIVCGYGEIGGAICGELKDQQLPFVVITDDDSSVAMISREGYAMVRGNPTADASLKEAEIERALGVIAVLADDSDNLFIALAARELNPKTFIIARGEDSSIEDRILRAGADIVVSPMKLGGRQIAGLIKQQASASSILDGSAVPSSVMGLGLKIFRHSGSLPMTVAEAVQKSGAVGAAGLHRQDGFFEPTPQLEAVLQPEDAVVVITKTDEGGDSFQKRATGKKILIADDHRALRLLFARKLASAGHEVIQAAAGDEALAQALACIHGPDLIVLDINMPKQNGYQVCAALRQHQRFADVPIILYSGEETEEFMQRGRESGATMCLRKTSKSSELLARIDEAFAIKPAHENSLKTAENVAAGQASFVQDSVPSNHVFNLEVAVENVDGDRQLLNELVTVLLEDTPHIMDRIGQAVAQLDHQSLQRESHSLKSSVAILGASQASAAAAKLESAGTDVDPHDLAQWHVDLQSHIDELTLALQEHRKVNQVAQ